MASLYDISIPALIRGLTNMSAILDKAAAHAAAKKFDSVALAQSRLFPDMHPLSRQVQIACDTAKGAAGRLAGIEVPKHEDTETTLAELKARIAKTVDFLKTVTAAQMKDAETRDYRNQVSERRLEVHRPRLPDRFRAAEFLFSRRAWSTPCCARAASKSARAIFWAPSSSSLSDPARRLRPAGRPAVRPA